MSYLLRIASRALLNLYHCFLCQTQAEPSFGGKARENPPSFFIFYLFFFHFLCHILKNFYIHMSRYLYNKECQWSNDQGPVLQVKSPEAAYEAKVLKSGLYLSKKGSRNSKSERSKGEGKQSKHVFVPQVSEHPGCHVIFIGRYGQWRCFYSWPFSWQREYECQSGKSVNNWFISIDNNPSWGELFNLFRSFPWHFFPWHPHRNK